VHAFSNPEADRHQDMGIAYNAAADRRSWALMLQWLAEAFGSPAK
jgi:dienelactone hydrolase